MRDLTKDSTHLYAEGSVQTFIDNLLIESVQDITRRWHAPERYQDGPVLRKDRPGKSSRCSAIQLLPAARPGRWTIQVLVRADGRPPRQEAHGAGDGVATTVRRKRGRYPLDETGARLVEVDGRKTNIVLGRGEHCMNVLIDPHPEVREERFKAFFTRMWDDNSQRQSQCAYSADGIHWQTYDELPQLGMAGPRLCDVTILFYDEDAPPVRPEHASLSHDCRRHPIPVGPRRILFATLRAGLFCQLQPAPRLAIAQLGLHPLERTGAGGRDRRREDNLDESFYGMPQFRVGNPAAGHGRRVSGGGQ